MTNSSAQNVTLKDIAAHTGYSLVSVHRAISGKSGIGEKSRQEILDAAQQMGYQVNRVASALKRSQLNVAICMPESAHYGSYYFKYIWKAIRDCAAEYQGYNIHWIEQEFPFPSNDRDEVPAQIASLDELDRMHGDHLDGLIVLPIGSAQEVQDRIERFAKRGTKVVLIDDDFPSSGRLCCVAPSDENTGRLGAELICAMLPGEAGSILVCGGNQASYTHSMHVKGFCDYVRTHRPDLNTILVPDPLHDRPNRETFMGKMVEGRVLAAYSTRARDTIPICDAAIALEGERKLLLVGSDLFPESADMLRRGVLRSIIYKNPYQKGFIGLKVLLENLLFGKPPKADTLTVPICVIMRNNLVFFEEFL